MPEGYLALRRPKMHETRVKARFGERISREVRDWIRAAAKLRIDHRGHGAQEAANIVLEMVRNLAIDEAEAIADARRTAILRRNEQKRRRRAEKKRENTLQHKVGF